MAYEFHYTPTGTGVISGKEVLEQTEDAINDLGNTAISGVQEALDKAEQALTNSANAVDDAQTALNTANNAEGVAIQAQNDVSNLSGIVTNLGNRVTTDEGNITDIQGRMTTAEGNITNLQGRMTTAEGNIGNLQTAVSTAQATANSAQQTATTARLQSYVFRYSSTVLVDSSTNSNALLDNTDNLKVGDKVLDSSGNIYVVTAIDTANSTFTIGSALIDIALDGDVVHKSGDETISGTKTFLDVPIPFKSSTAELGVTGGSTKVIFTDKNLLNLAGITFGNYGSSKLSYCRFHIYDKDSNNQEIENYIEFSYVNNNQFAYFRPNSSNFVTLGTINNRWYKVYANEYYYGSNNVEFSSKFVTTDTAQTVSGVKTITNANLEFKSTSAEYGVSAGDSSVIFKDKNNLQTFKVYNRVFSSGLDNNLVSFFITQKVDNTYYTSNGIQLFTNTGNKNVALRPILANNNADGLSVSLGASDRKWSDVLTYKVNGVEPSSLSLPSQTYVDISSYFTNTGTGEYNTYTAPSNGWIFLRLGDISSCQARVLDSSDNILWGTSSSGSVEMITIPILSGCKLQTQWATGSAVTVATARFIPCQGNV